MIVRVRLRDWARHDDECTHKDRSTGMCALSTRPLDVAQIGVAPPPSLSSVCQMAGGSDSPDIHQCLAVRCSRSSDLTCRLHRQNSFPLLGGAARTLPNDAAK